MNGKKILLVVLGILAFGNLFFIVNYLEPTIVGNEVGVGFMDSDENSGFPETGFVTKVIDGDTVVVFGESVRLLGIDTDERGGDCYKEAKTRLEELVLNKEVMLEIDKEDKDQYKRYLRHLILDGENINLKMVEEGMAIARFYEDRKYKEEILNAEIEARENKIGCKWRNLQN